MMDRETARRIYASKQAHTQSRQKETGKNPYLMNASHPIVQAFLKDWCIENGLNPSMPLGDVQRTQFEASLLNETVLARLPALLEQDEIFRKKWGHVL